MKDKFNRFKESIREFISDNFIDFVIGVLVCAFFWVLFGGLKTIPTKAEEDLTIERTYTEFVRSENGIWTPFYYRTYDLNTYDNIYISDTDFSLFDDISTLYPNGKIIFDLEGAVYSPENIYNLNFFFNFDIGTGSGQCYLTSNNCTINLYCWDSLGYMKVIYPEVDFVSNGDPSYSLRFSVPIDTYRLRVEVLYNLEQAFPTLDKAVSDPRYQFGIELSEPTLSIVGSVPITPDLPNFSGLDDTLTGSVDDVLNELLDRAPTGTDSLSLFARAILSHHVILDTLTIVVCFGVVSFILYGKE